MPGAAFSIYPHADFSAWTALAQRLASFPAERQNAAMDEMGEGLVSSTVARIHSQHAPDGTPWSQSERAKREHGETLIWRGFLIRSLTHNVIPVSGLEWGSPLKYARAHQDGEVIHVYPRSQLVARKLERDAQDDNKGDFHLGKFAKRKKADFESWAAIGGNEGYDINIPARPYLGIDNADIAMGVRLLARHVGAAIAGINPGASA